MNLESNTRALNVHLGAFDQSVANWLKYAEVFDKYKLNFCFALNSSLFEGNLDYIKLINYLHLES